MPAKRRAREGNAAEHVQAAPAGPAPPEVEAALGYRFRSASLLRRALTHASAGDASVEGDNERLEFLGDRVLGLVVAEMVLAASPAAREGEVARLFNRLVRREACVAVAEAIGIGAHLVLSSGEADSGGRSKPTILADACEAVIAAVYLDGGFEAARALVRRFWQPMLADAAPAPPSDAKTALQEWSQGKALPIPAYRTIERQGPDHAPWFTVEVVIPGFEPAQGTGASKRIAARNAAQSFLERERIWRARPQAAHGAR